VADKFKKGDRVTWNSGGGTATGEVQKKVTKRTDINGQTVDASEADPRYLVKNDNTGNVTGHRADTLSKLSTASTKRQKKRQKASSDNYSSDSQTQPLQRVRNIVNITTKQVKSWLGRG
jgi:hypothetical protein